MRGKAKCTWVIFAIYIPRVSWILLKQTLRGNSRCAGSHFRRNLGAPTKTSRCRSCVRRKLPRDATVGGRNPCIRLRLAISSTLTTTTPLASAIRIGYDALACSLRHAGNGHAIRNEAGKLPPIRRTYMKINLWMRDRRDPNFSEETTLVSVSSSTWDFKSRCIYLYYILFLFFYYFLFYFILFFILFYFYIIFLYIIL